MTRHRDLEAELHPSVRAARDLRATADLWPQLRAALQPGSTPQSGGKRTKRDAAPLPINAHVSDVLAEISSWAYFWARVLADETHWAPPGSPPRFDPARFGRGGLIAYLAATRLHAQAWAHSTPSLLRALALRTGHFTEHEDQVLALAFVDECREMKRKAEATVTPSGTRRVHVPMACEVDGCDGAMYAPIHPDATYYPDLICDKNRNHRIEPLVYSRLSWKHKAS